MARGPEQLLRERTEANTTKGNGSSTPKSGCSNESTSITVGRIIRTPSTIATRPAAPGACSVTPRQGGCRSCRCTRPPPPLRPRELSALGERRLNGYPLQRRRNRGRERAGIAFDNHRAAVDAAAARIIHDQAGDQVDRLVDVGAGEDHDLRPPRS